MGKGLIIGIIVAIIVILVLVFSLGNFGGQETTTTDTSGTDNVGDDTVLDDDGGDAVDDDSGGDNGGTDAPQTYTVEMSSAGFSPSSLTINVGDIVVFVAVGGSNRWPASAVHPTHNVYPESTGACPIIGGSDFDACGTVATSYPFTFNEIGSWGYHDHLSPGKTG